MMRTLLRTLLLAVLPLHLWFHRAFRSHAKRPEGQQQAASEGGSSWARSLHKMQSVMRPCTIAVYTQLQ